jgi:hypothetical protein
MTDIPLNKLNDFLERVEKELSTLKISEKQKKCVLELLEMEINYPTTDISRYKDIIELNLKE